MLSEQVEKEMRQHNITDTLTDFVSLMEVRGCRRMLRDLEESYPRHYEELKAQITRGVEKQIPALLKG